MRIAMNDDPAIELLRRAAEIGPGFRGSVRKADAAERESLLAAFSEAGLAPPSFLSAQVEWIPRRAKLFEAGDYPDKGVSVTAEQLQSLCARFSAPVPVWIEHAESPLEIGYLTAVEAAGDELFGTVALSSEANALVERSGTRSLSIGLAPDLSEIREVSLVSNPRIASARLFSALSFEGGTLEFSNPEELWRTRYERLLEGQAREEARRKVASMISEGRICPAQAPFAEALLSFGGTITFNGSEQPVAALMEGFLQRQSPMALFGERVPATTAEAPHALLLPEEAQFYKRYFPDVSLDSIAGAREAR